MDEQQQAAWEQAVERKKEAARAASEQTQQDHPPATDPVDGPIQQTLISTATTQDAFDPRDKNTSKGKHTADKWNQ